MIISRYEERIAYGNRKFDFTADTLKELNEAFKEEYLISDITDIQEADVMRALEHNLDAVYTDTWGDERDLQDYIVDFINDIIDWNGDFEAMEIDTNYTGELNYIKVFDSEVQI